jgi:hypothetical protein
MLALRNGDGTQSRFSVEIFENSMPDEGALTISVGDVCS